jgi:hypothetical protein
MVSLAELDASELETEAVPASESVADAGTPGRAQQPTFGAALNSLMAPVDAATGKLALFFSGGRVR